MRARTDANSTEEKDEARAVLHPRSTLKTAGDPWKSCC